MSDMYNPVIAIAWFIISLFALRTAYYLVIFLINHGICVYRLNRLNLPGLKGNFFSGVALEMIVLNRMKGIQPNIRPLMAALGMCAPMFKGEGIIQLNAGIVKPIAILCKAEAAEVLLSDTKEVKKTVEYEYLSDWLGQGLITSFPDIWRKHRKMLTPTFHFRILDGFQPIMDDHSGVLVNILKEGTKEDFVHVELPVTLCTLDIISETALGIKLGAQYDGNSDYVQSIFKTTALVTQRMLSPWLWPNLFMYMSPTGRKLRGHLKIMNTFIKKMIAQRKAELEEELKGMSPQEIEEAIPKKRRAFLDTLLLHNISNPKEKLSEQEIMDEVHTFTFTAHDSVAMAIYWVMYYLGLYQDVQKKVQEEIETVLNGDTKSQITLEDVKQMGYLERVIKESQRLTPLVPAVTRSLQEDLNIHGVVLPKGTTVGVFLMAIQRDPDHFEHPNEFIPDRFLESKRHPFAFIPFSGGPRGCLGQKYAQLCMKTVLANLLRNLSWTSLDPLDKVMYNPEFAIRPGIPLRIKFESRN